MVDDAEYGQVIQLQGDQRTKIQDLLLGEGIGASCWALLSRMPAAELYLQTRLPSRSTDSEDVRWPAYSAHEYWK